MKTDLFQSCGHCWVFQISWCIQCSTLTTSSFKIWNSSAGIPSPPPALLVVMISKAHLTSQVQDWDPPKLLQAPKFLHHTDKPPPFTFRVCWGQCEAFWCLPVTPWRMQLWIQAQVYTPQNTASRLLLLKEKPGWFEGCPLLFPQDWLPGFRERCKDKKRLPLLPLLSDWGRAKTKEEIACVSTQVHAIRKIRKAQSLLKLLVFAFSRVQWKLLTWLLNDSWQLGVWSSTRTKY